MTTSAELDFTAVVVTPGDTATTSLTVRNDSDIVEAYTFEVIGPCAPWAEVEPARLSLYPGTSGTVTIRLHPPRSPEVRAGEVPLAVRVLPTEKPELVAVPETTVTIEAFGQLDATLVPQRRRGWWRARFRAQLRNEGNTPITVALDATDAAAELRYRGVPSSVAIEPGDTAEVRLRVRVRKLIWFGKSVGTPFQLVATPEATPPIEKDPPLPRALDGELVQLAILPRWLLALLALLIALVVAWFALVRPAVRSAAKQAAEDKANQLVQAGQLAPGPSAPNAPAAQKPGAAANTSQANPAQTGAAQPGTAGGNGQQSSATIEVRTNGGAQSTGAYTVPTGKVFLITDLVLANFQGDEGVLTVAFGDRTITTIAMETFRNQDYHWVTPIEVPADATVSAAVTCAKPGTPASGQQAAGCVEVLNVNGELRDQPQPSR
ncbi:hydrolytic protein [Solihabitans fulvus]|uniref:Hydrolytic protein n=1 Tax=Solihabitans fulvus TaxID=1892852 RepID=A0A5B2X4J4_9PSEU|nr:hydrolytic protein [Solihabitans fulvus]KAA2258075.1 hydrolytic protein [Solihabitans fulvus]